MKNAEDNILAVIEIAAAFSRGARMGRKLRWNDDTAKHGRDWVWDKVYNSQKDWGAIRDVVLGLADKVGQFAATHVKVDLPPAIEEDVMEERHLKNALSHLGKKKPRVGRAMAEPGVRFKRGDDLDDCPF